MAATARSLIPPQRWLNTLPRAADKRGVSAKFCSAAEARIEGADKLASGEASSGRRSPPMRRRLGWIAVADKSESG